MAIKSGLILAIFWFLLSGHTSPLILGLGLASVALTVFLTLRMKVIDHEAYPFHLTFRLPVYFAYLGLEIIKANLDVIRRVLGKSIDPQLVELPVPQKTDLGRVIYANSITLTPGTVSVNLEEDKVLVHALSKDGADDLATGAMAKAVPDKVVNKG